MPAKKSTAPKKTARKPGKRKSAPSKKPARSWLWRLLPSKRVVLWLLFIIVSAFLIWLVWLDTQVRQKFEGKKWAVPARVYARPLELYEGLALKPEELQRELKTLGYKPVKQTYGAGQYAREGMRYSLFTREFLFADGVTKAARYSFSFASHQGQTVISQLQGIDDSLVLRLEPKEIGSIYPGHGEDRILVNLDAIPPLLGETIIAVEDKEFAHHHGLSFRGISRAMLANIKARRFVQGGSTLTQQLVKNFYLTQDRKLGRKIQEAFMAVLLERRYSKAEILEAYINEVYLGQSGPRAIHGFGLAAKHYFNRPLKNLQAHQIALLVATVKGASYYNPWRHPKRALNRRNTVLKIMADNQLISVKEYQKFSQRPLDIVNQADLRLGDYPAFLELVKRQLREDYREEDLQSEGLRIFTTMSPNVQELTESVVHQRLSQLNKKLSGQPLQAAAVVTAVGSGEVLAVVGDRNPRYSGFNRVLNMRRPIGSLVKPFVYLAALSQPETYTLISLLDDSSVSFKQQNGELWQPKNYDKQSHGQVPLYEALAFSYNQSTARLGMDVGLSRVVSTLKLSGLSKDVRELPSLLLGSLELSPLEVSHLYHTLAADGVYTPLRTIRSVQNSGNKPLQRYPLISEPRISSELSYLMHYNLQAVMRQGTGRGAYRYLPDHLMVAGKTGTTNEQRDSWFAGYSADHLGVVWLGRDDNKPTSYTGSSGALPIWSNIFSGVSTQGISYQQPSRVEYYWVDEKDGLLSAKDCENSILVPFVAGSQPQQKTDCQWTQVPLKRWFDKWFGNE